MNEESDDDVTPAKAREVIETYQAWSSDNRATEEKARDEAKTEATKVSLRWYLITVGITATITAVMSVGFTVTLFNAWSPDRTDVAGFELSLPAGGGEQDCARDPRSSDERPRFVCWRSPR